MESDKPCWSRLFHGHLFELQTASGRVLLPKKEKLVEVLFCRDGGRTSWKKNSLGVFFLLGKQETRSVRYVKQQNNLVTLLMVSFLISFSLPIKKKTACKVSEISVMWPLSGKFSKVGIDKSKEKSRGENKKEQKKYRISMLLFSPYFLFFSPLFLTPTLVIFSPTPTIFSYFSILHPTTFARLFSPPPTFPFSIPLLPPPSNFLLLFHPNFAYGEVGAPPRKIRSNRSAKVGGGVG